MEATQGHFPPIMATFPDVGPWHVGGPEEATLGHFPRYGAMEPWSHGHPHTLVVVQWDKSPFIYIERERGPLIQAKGKNFFLRQSLIWVVRL